MDEVKLDDYERGLVDSLEAGEWRSVPDVEAEISRHVQFASDTIKSSKHFQRWNDVE